MTRPPPPPGFELIDEIPPPPPGFELEQPREASRIGHVKAAGVGLANAGIYAGGMSGDIREMNAAAASKLAGLAGFDIPQEKVSSVLKYVPWMGGPTSEKLKQGVEGVTGKFYEPVGSEKYTQTAAEFAPAAIPGRAAATVAREVPALAGRLVGRAAVPGVASEGLGQAAEAVNPSLGPVGRVVGGVGASLATAPKQVSAALKPAQIEARATAGYQSPEVAAVVFKPSAVDALASSIEADLRRAKANVRLAPQTNALIDDLRVPVSGAAHTYEDLQTTRELLQKQAGNFANPQEQRAASVALEKLTKYIDNIPQADLAAGNAAQASARITAARGDYASAKTAERVADKIYNAELGAGSAHSGGNIQNALRQQTKTLLSKKGRRGLNEAEFAQVEEGVKGSLPANVLRATGKLLGGGGGLGAALTTGGAYGLFGLPGLVAAPFGYGIKKAGDVLARRKAEALVQAILERAPSAASQTRANIANYDPRARLARLLALETSGHQGQRP